MNYHEAFDQLMMKLMRIRQVYAENDSSSLIDMAENGQFLYDNLDELIRSAENWRVE